MQAPKLLLRQNTFSIALRALSSTSSSNSNAAANSTRSQRPKLFSSVPDFVKIVEVGPRDGLQNEPKIVSTEAKIKLIELLSDAGLSVVEATSFVSPKWVPQMADASQVLQGIKRSPNTSYPVLTPNMQGYKNAVAAGATEVAVFNAASEGFSNKNTGKGVMQNAVIHGEIAHAAKLDGVRVRGYVSCVLGCPYDGAVSADNVARVAEMLVNMGCYEISLGDTIGVGNPVSTIRMLEAVARVCDLSQIAVHFHNTYGTALANITAAVQTGVSVVDSSVAGLGGCPYAKGATGNVPTEDVVYMLHGMGIDTGIDVQKLCIASTYITNVLEKPSRSLAGIQLTNKLLNNSNTQQTTQQAQQQQQQQAQPTSATTLKATA